MKKLTPERLGALTIRLAEARHAFETARLLTPMTPEWHDNMAAVWSFEGFCRTECGLAMTKAWMLTRREATISDFWDEEGLPRKKQK